MLITSLGCRNIEPAPEDFDEIMHYLWYKADSGTDEELAQAIRNLHLAIDGDSLIEARDGTLARLVTDEIDFVENAGDPSIAPGIYLLNPYICSLTELTEIITHADQEALYPNVYESYQRNYVNSRDDFVDGSSDRLNWTLEYGASLLGSSYTASLLSMMRRIPDLGDEQNSFGEAILWQAHLIEPADFGDSSKSLNQDYQIDLYYPYNNSIIHAYAMWREASYGAGFSTEDEAVQRITLNNLVDWDKQTETLCADGIPQ
jgi:hypothetical protein